MEDQGHHEGGGAAIPGGQTQGGILRFQHSRNANSAWEGAASGRGLELFGAQFGSRYPSWRSVTSPGTSLPVAETTLPTAYIALGALSDISARRNSDRASHRRT